MRDELARLRDLLAGHYAIERQLGAGATATVWLARDLRHDREVALKVLRPELSAALGTERFLREIQVTARLQHPHILTLIDSGSSDGLLWYVVPYVRGESLRDRLNRERQLGIDEALAIVRQVAAALDYAHAQGVVHRDIKPENILLHEGEAVLADFGIALATREAGGERLTGTGMWLGTPAYMSPEQAEGNPALDTRSDVYSLAAVLYEMLAGEPPFTGATLRALSAKLLSERPTRLRTLRDAVPEAVDQAVARALEKVPADRFATAGDFVAGLAGSAAMASAGTAARRRRIILAAVATVIVGGALIIGWRAGIAGLSEGHGGSPSGRVAVLPCRVIGADPSTAALALGIADQLISQLYRLAQVKPIALTSLQKYREGDRNVRAISRELQGAAVLDCALQVADGQVAATAHLYDADGGPLWSEPYRREMRDLLDLQSELASLIAESVSGVLSKEDRIRLAGAAGTANHHALTQYTLGTQQPPTEEGLARELEHFNAAIALDSQFALAHAGLARALSRQGMQGLRLPREVRDTAKAAARRALALNPGLGEAHAVLASLLYQYDWDWPEAEKEFRRALDLAPSSARVRDAYGHYLTLMGRFDEGIEELEAAADLDPLNPMSTSQVGWAYVIGGLDEDGVRHCRETLERFPEFQATRIPLAWGLASLGRYHEALQQFDTVRPFLSDADVVFRASEALVNAMAGRPAEARAIHQQLQDVAATRFLDPGRLATASLAAGDTLLALDQLEEAYAIGSTTMAFLRIDQQFLLRGLRQQPRFAALLARLRFPGSSGDLP